MLHCIGLRGNFERKKDMEMIIIKTEGAFGRDESPDFKKFGLKIGDKIKVSPFVGNAVIYQPVANGAVLFIYKWNIEPAPPTGA